MQIGKIESKGANVETTKTFFKGVDAPDRGMDFGMMFFRLSKKEQRKLAPYLDDWFRREFGEELKNLEE